jgi:chorismate dehydratase
MIFSKVPIEEIRSLALDKTSRTSATLARILLKRKLDALPTLTQCTPQSVLNDISEDAMMLIGDAAMVQQSEKPPFSLDLGDEWKRQTGLPFVYAMWVARNDVQTRDLHQRLLEARDEGLLSLTEIASEASRELNLDMDLCVNYLQNIMRYSLDSDEVEALKLFQKLAADDGLCRGDVKIVIDC